MSGTLRSGSRARAWFGRKNSPDGPPAVGETEPAPLEAELAGHDDHRDTLTAGTRPRLAGVASCGKERPQGQHDRHRSLC